MVRTFEDKVNSAPLDEEWLDRLNEANERVQGVLYIISWIIDLSPSFCDLHCRESDPFVTAYNLHGFIRFILTV